MSQLTAYELVSEIHHQAERRIRLWGAIAIVLHVIALLLIVAALWIRLAERSSRHLAIEEEGRRAIQQEIPFR